jgi:hypothetical protein
MYDYKLEEEMDTAHDAYKAVQVSHIPSILLFSVIFLHYASFFLSRESRSLSI